jgi:hypothetical protein
MRSEFGKVDGAKEALRRKYIDILYGLVATVMPLWMGSHLLHAGPGSPADLTSGQQASGIAALVAYGALAWSGRLGCKMLPVFRTKRARDIVLISFIIPVVLWWIIFMNFFVPCHVFTMGQLTVAFLWAFVVPGGAIIGLAWGLEAKARREVAPAVA